MHYTLNKWPWIVYYILNKLPWIVNGMSFTPQQNVDYIIFIALDDIVQHDIIYSSIYYMTIQVQEHASSEHPSISQM